MDKEKTSRHSFLRGRMIRNILWVMCSIFVIGAVFIYVPMLKEKTYTSESDSFTIYSSNEMDKYVSSGNTLNLLDSSYSTDESGIRKMISDYRKPLYKHITKKGTSDFKNSDPLKVYRVLDDGKTVEIQMIRNDKNRVEYYNDDKKFLDDTLDTRFVNSDEDKLMMSVVYMYKDNRNVNVKFGNVRVNKYNKKEFVKSDGGVSSGDGFNSYDDPNKKRNISEFSFNKSELAKVSNWGTYSVKRLKQLNEYKDKK